MTDTVTTRFCPSPTGLMHLGNARTALFSALYALKQQGTFLLRIEDTDPERSKPAFTQQLQQDLTWLGLTWQEGPEVGGENGPYFQSERLAVYNKYYQDLIQQGLAYPCFCSEQQLAMVRKAQRAAGQPPRYPGTCRGLSVEEIANKRREGCPETLRFRVPRGEQVAFDDLVKGTQRFSTDDLGDFIIRRTDGTAPFMYCNALDDALMAVTHVLRGEDHLTNTPRQILILQALNLPIPHYGHIALIMGPDNAPLSKRNGSRAVSELQQVGFFPEAVVNYLARLGHYYADNRFMTLAQLAEQFNFEQLGSAPARFDASQLNYWQKEAMSAASWQQVWQLLKADVQSLVPSHQQQAFVDAVKANCVFPEELTAWAHCLFTDNLQYDEQSQAVLKASEPKYFEVALQALEQHGLDHHAWCSDLKQQLGIKGKALFQPLRVALTNQLHGPELAPLVELIGEARIKQRLQQAHDEMQ